MQVEVDLELGILCVYTPVVKRTLGHNQRWRSRRSELATPERRFRWCAVEPAPHPWTRGPMSGREKPGLITDPTAFAYRPTHLHGGGTGLDDAWANWANDRRHIDSPSHGMATSPVPFESHSPVLPSTPDSMIFWGDPGLDPESDSDADSDSEGHPLAETTGIQGRLNTAAQPLLLASPPPTGSKKSEALDDATSERGPAARPGGSAGPAVQILILEDGEKAASERVPRPGPRSKQEPKLNNDRAAPRVRAAEKPEPDENLSREEQEEKAKKVQIANLAKRFPSLNLEEVKEALAATSFHAGRASKVLMRKVMDQRQAVDDMLEKEAEAVGALGAQTQPARPLAVNTSHGSSLAAADSQLPSAIQLTGSEAQPGINGIWVKSGKVNDRPAYLLTEESGLVMYWQYNIDVRCADGMQNQWLIADKVGSGYRAAVFGLPGGGPLDVPPRSWQVATNGSWVAEESISLSSVKLYRAARDAVATLERDLDKLGRFQDPTEAGRFLKGEKVMVTQMVETNTGLRVKTAYGWVSMVAVSGVALLEPWKETREIDMSGVLGRQKPASHRTAQKFAEIDGILGLPRFPAMKPFHGAVLSNPRLRTREAPMRHGPLLPPPAVSAVSGLVLRQPERLTKQLPDLDVALHEGVRRQMAVSKTVAREQLLPLISWSDHLAQSRSRFALATPPSGAPPTATFRRLHPGAHSTAAGLSRQGPYPEESRSFRQLQSDTDNDVVDFAQPRHDDLLTKPLWAPT